ncbi:DsbA family protein [Erythrobacter litoralis]|uniref:DsbA family protein n=1 Tax=Erythrobacter litoralis TaxID=39960 RepID=UPI0024347F14|nr:DsbA family protein [Erythrobacter litoralis]MDG6079391.1 DsbA family protein [Erythrobacter litoralis]
MPRHLTKDWTIVRYLLTAIVALVAGFGGAALWSMTGMANAGTREYLVANPDILPEMAEAYQRGQAQERLAAIGPEAEAAFPGAVLGNPNGSKTLVKFSDYACSYCRLSVAEVEKLIAENPDLKVVLREWPIFQGSEEAARMGLAAAQQGKYDAFYHAMFELGPPNAQSIAAAAQRAGLDMEAATAFAASEQVTAELAKNQALAGQLGFSGTPSWIVEGEVVEGYVDHDRLARLLEGEAT